MHLHDIGKIKHHCYFDKGIPAVQGLGRGQSFGHTLSGGQEGTLDQILLQLCGIHLRKAEKCDHAVSSILWDIGIVRSLVVGYLQKLAGHVEML